MCFPSGLDVSTSLLLPSCLWVPGLEALHITTPPQTRMQGAASKTRGPLLCPLSHGERGGHLGQEKRTKWKPEVYLGRLFSDATYGGTLMKLQGEFLSDNT